MGRLSRLLVLSTALVAPVAAQEGYGDDQQQQQYQQQQYDQQYQQQQQYDQQYQQQSDQQPYDDNMPPPDPNAYPQAVQYAFMGPHPIPYDMGGGYCYQSGPHYHDYAPFDQYLFRESGGYWYFVGDPGDFGYTQQLWGYNGNHPIPLSWGGGYCYINWPHRHPYPPPSTVYFNFVGGYYVYNGPWDPVYWQWRDRYAGYFGGYYRHNYYGGRYWVVRPPPVYRPAVRVGAPGVRVVPPGHRGGVVVPPPGRRGGVVVGAPPGRVYVPAPHAPGPHYGAPAPHYGAPAPRYGAPAQNVAPPPVRRSAPPPPRRAPAPRVVAPPPARHR